VLSLDEEKALMEEHEETLLHVTECLVEDLETHVGRARREGDDLRRGEVAAAEAEAARQRERAEAAEKENREALATLVAASQVEDALRRDSAAQVARERERGRKVLARAQGEADRVLRESLAAADEAAQASLRERLAAQETSLREEAEARAAAAARRALGLAARVAGEVVYYGSLFNVAPADLGTRQQERDHAVAGLGGSAEPVDALAEFMRRAADGARGQAHEASVGALVGRLEDVLAAAFLRSEGEAGAGAVGALEPAAPSGGDARQGPRASGTGDDAGGEGSVPAVAAVAAGEAGAALYEALQRVANSGFGSRVLVPALPPAPFGHSPSMSQHGFPVTHGGVPGYGMPSYAMPGTWTAAPMGEYAVLGPDGSVMGGSGGGGYPTPAPTPPPGPRLHGRAGGSAPPPPPPPLPARRPAAPGAPAGAPSQQDGAGGLHPPHPHVPLPGRGAFAPGVYEYSAALGLSPVAPAAETEGDAPEYASGGGDGPFSVGRLFRQPDPSASPAPETQAAPGAPQPGPAGWDAVFRQPQSWGGNPGIIFPRVDSQEGPDGHWGAQGWVGRPEQEAPVDPPAAVPAPPPPRAEAAARGYVDPRDAAPSAPPVKASPATHAVPSPGHLMGDAPGAPARVTAGGKGFRPPKMGAPKAPPAPPAAGAAGAPAPARAPVVSTVVAPPPRAGKAKKEVAQARAVPRGGKGPRAPVATATVPAAGPPKLVKEKPSRKAPGADKVRGEATPEATEGAAPAPAKGLRGKKEVGEPREGRKGNPAPGEKRGPSRAKDAKDAKCVVVEAKVEATRGGNKGGRGTREGQDPGGTAVVCL